MDPLNLQKDVNQFVLLSMKPKQRKMLQSHFQILDKWSTVLSLQSLPTEAAWPDSCLGTDWGQQETETSSESGPESGQLACWSSLEDEGTEIPRTQRPRS